MLDQLRDRNLAHVGCTLGLLLGLVLGMVAALLVISLVATDSAVGWATVALVCVTVGLGALGYHVGSRSSRRLWRTNRTPDDE